MKITREELIGYLLDAALWNLHEAYFAEDHGQQKQAEAYRARGEKAQKLIHMLTDTRTRGLDFEC